MTTHVNEAVSNMVPDVVILSEADFAEFSMQVESSLPTDKLEALTSAPSPFERREVSTEDIINLAHNSARAPRFPATFNA